MPIELAFVSPWPLRRAVSATSSAAAAVSLAKRVSTAHVALRGTADRGGRGVADAALPAASAPKVHDAAAAAWPTTPGGAPCLEASQVGGGGCAPSLHHIHAAAAGAAVAVAVVATAAAPADTPATAAR